MLANMALGIDIVDVKRFRKLIEKLGSALEERLYTYSELKNIRDDIKKRAAYFAVKESVSKALGVGIDYISNNGINLCDVEISEMTGSSACVNLNGRAASLANKKKLLKWLVSYSCSTDLVVAFVVASNI